MFKECVQTMRSLKSELKIVKEYWRRRQGIKTLDHNDEEVEEEENAPKAAEEEDLRDKWLKFLSEMKGRYKMEVSTVMSKILNWFIMVKSHFPYS